MIRIAVCDDSPLAIRTTVQMISRWSEQRGMPVDICSFENGDSLISKCAASPADVIFLDIIMPLLNGIDAARELRLCNSSSRIVFLTSSPEFALESYEVKAQNYILKPVTYEKLAEVLDGCARDLNEEPDNIVLRTNFGYQKIYLYDIEYAEAQNKQVIFYLRDGKSIEALEQLRVFESRLTVDSGFFKCHRSYLLCMANVDRFSSLEIITRSGRSIPIARGYAKAFKEAYFTYMFSNRK